jgi:DNA-directed RNA polymerase specialized sigma24 family protein
MKFPAKEVADHVRVRVMCMRRLYPHLHINRHDWDDMIQDIVIHVARKWHMQRGDKWHRWVDIIARRQVMNMLRNRIADYRRMPLVSMISRIEQYDDMGGEQVVYEPDTPAHEDGVDKTRAALATLPRPYDRLVQEFMKCGTWDGTRKRMKTSPYRVALMREEMAKQVKAMI